MRLLRSLIALAIFFGCLLPLAHACGRERWLAKNLGDGTALDGPIRTVDVNYLRALPRPGGTQGFDAPRVPAERRMYHVYGELLGFKLEDDGDIHAIIAESGDRSATVIVEIPDPRCMYGAPAVRLRQVAQTRLAFVKRSGIPPYRSMRLAYQPIAVTGPAFFDFEHGQGGAAPNDVEIHPVLALSGSLTPAAHRDADWVPNGAASQHRLTCPEHTVLSLNKRSGVYPLHGNRYDGSSTHGAYMCRRAADAQA